ncbi:Annexin-B12 [Dactylellina cionopaga]|nr:Annexin-B12 [Dactylellina cionopaga]
MASYHYQQDMYQNPYPDPNQAHHPPPQNYQYPDPNLNGHHDPRHQSWYDPNQYQYPQQLPPPPPLPPHPHQPSSDHHGEPLQPPDWTHPSDPPAHQPSHYNSSPAPQPYGLAPPAYDPYQRPMSWPSSPHGYQQHHYATSNPSHATPSSGMLQPPTAHSYAPPAPQSHHGHHHSISGPLSLPVAPGTGFPGFPSNSHPRSSDLALEDAQKIRDAFGVGGLHPTAVISIIANRSPAHLNDIQLSYKNLTGHDLLATLRATARANKLSKLVNTNNKYFKTAVTAILLGPVKSEGFWAVKAVKGNGTNEPLLTEAIFGRSNDELEGMKSYVRSCYYKTLEEYVRSDLSMGTRDLFDMGMEPDESKDPRMQMMPEYAKIQLDVRKIISATPNYNVFSKNATIACQILTQRTPGQIVAIVEEYKHVTGKPLRDLIGKAFFGHMKDSLLYIVDGAVDKTERDAKLLEEAMVGAGTRNHLLISRLIRIYWNKQHLAEVKFKYSQLYKQELVHRIRKEIKGSYRDLMIAIAESDTSPWRQ